MALLDDRGGGTSQQTTQPAAPKPGDIVSSAVTLSDGRVINVLQRWDVIGSHFDPVTRQNVPDYGWVSVGSPIFPESGGGGGSQAYSSTSAAQEDMQAFQAEQDRLAREFQAEQNRLQAEAAERQSRLNALTDLITNFATNQQKARDLLFQLGPDPFKFAAASQGMAQRGVTPQQAYATDLSAFSNQAIPAVNPNASTADINAAINGITGGTGVVPGLPQGPAAFGMAGGGEVSFDQFGPMPTRIRVGELGPETLEVTNRGFRVIPNGMMPAHMGAATGFDAYSMEAALKPIWNAAGISGYVPKINQTPGGFTTQASEQQLGWNSPLITEASTGKVFWRDPTGALHHIPNPDVFNQAGFNWSAPLITQSLNGFGPVSDSFTPAMLNKDWGVPQAEFGPYGGPIVTKSGGFELPAPFRVANTLKMLKDTNPSLYSTILSGYEDAGLPANYVEAQVDAATIQGFTPQTARRLIGFR